MPAPFCFQPVVRARCRGRAGFTLVELMVAMTGGLFLSIVVFSLSRDASRFYQRETRVANATLAGLSGFERLSSDVARAGHMVTSNIQQDPHVCNKPQANWPAMLRTLRGLVVETDATPSAGTEVAAAGIQPQGVVIAGALNTPEVLYTNLITEDGNGSWLVYVNLATPAAARVGLSPLATAEGANLAAMQSIFMTSAGGRIIRLRRMGMDQYAVVASVSTSGAEAVITLAQAPALFRPATAGAQCGIGGDATGTAISAIDLVRYNIRPMVSVAGYAALFKASGLGTGGGAGVLPYEGGRAELVRVELTPAGLEIAGTREIVGEYAVDLQLSAWGATSSANPALVQVAAATINDTYVSTQLLRGVHLRFSVRSREADRDADVTGVSTGNSSDRYRIGVGPSGAAPFARVRTFQSDVALRNLENGNW